jgi:putative colanic acid biosynthesis glycosyltransferase
MLKLLQICVEGNTGSTGRMAEAIGNLAIQRDWESYIAYGRFPRPSSSNLIRIGSDIDVVLHGIETRIFDNHCFSSRAATIRLVKRIIDIKPDIIHLHHLHGYYINIRVLFNFLSDYDRPVVWTFHDCWSFTGHCAHFDFIGCERWKTQCYSCPQKGEYPASYLFDRSRRNYLLKKSLFTSVKKMVIVPVSNWLGSIVKDSFMGSIPIKRIYNGIDTSIFEPQKNSKSVRDKYGIGNKFMIIGVASPWTKKKGLNDFFELCKLLNENQVVVLVGLNKLQLKQLPEKIIGLSKTENRQELIDLYSAADVFVNPTWEDNFPTTNLEALSCGTPVVTYRTGGSLEAISSDTGFIVEKGDISGLSDVIKKVESSGKDFFLPNCRKRALENYDKNDRFEEYFVLYNDLLHNKRSLSYEY